VQRVAKRGKIVATKKTSVSGNNRLGYQHAN
jgi:hypothetical protein